MNIKKITVGALLIGMVVTVHKPVKATPASGSHYNPGHGATDYNPRYNISQSNVRYGRVCTKSYNGRLSMRTGLGTGYRKITEIPNQRYIPLFSGKYANDGFWWWNVNYNGYRGWVRSDFVCEDPQ